MDTNFYESDVNLFETGITPEDITKRSHNGMAIRKEYEQIPWKSDEEIYDPASLEGIKIANGDIFAQVGETLKLNVVQAPVIANIPELYWESSDYSIVSVDQDGVILAKAVGQADITVSKPMSIYSDFITVNVTADGKVGPDKPVENENTEEQNQIEEDVAAQILAGTNKIDLEGVANNLVIPAENTKSVTINGSFQDGAVIKNESGKSMTINNTGDPIDIVVESSASVTLKGNYNNVWANSKTINASNAKIGSVTFDNELEGKGNLSVNADWNDPVEVITYNTNNLNISNASDTAVLEDITITAPRATVTLNGKWGSVDATVSKHTLYLGASCHVEKLKVNTGNVIVYNCNYEEAYDEIELAEGCTISSYTKQVPEQGTNLTSYAGIYYINSECSSTNGIVFGIVASGNFKYINNASLTSNNSNAICLTRSAVNVYFEGNGEWISPNGYGIWKSSEGGEMKIFGGTFIANTHCCYAEKGFIEIYGGEFKIKGEDKTYLLNCKDDQYTAGKAGFKVYGGKFYGFDPAHSNAEPGGEVNWVQEGYQSVEIEPGIWEVSKI